MLDSQTRLEEIQKEIKQLCKDYNWTYDMLLQELRKRIFRRRKNYNG